MDVSLDDIIKKNKIKKGAVGRNKRGGKRLNPQKNVSAPNKMKNGIAKKVSPVAAIKKVGVSDLRMLIASKPKSSVRDAREKLMGGPISRGRLVPFDARERINRNSRATEVLMRSGRGKYEPFLIPYRTVENRNRGKPAYMDLEEARLKRRYSGGSLLYRTIDNHHSPLDEMIEIDSWEEPSVQDLTRFQSITRTLHQDDGWQSSVGYGAQNQRRSNNVKGRLQPNRAQDEGYRIVVSNLQPSVTHEDIQELFEDIGSLYSSRVVRPGTAEVVYKNMDDAVKAVDTYHNRQLDGCPMKCLLVKPSNVAKQISSKGSVVPDLHAIHKALFNK